MVYDLDNVKELLRSFGPAEWTAFGLILFGALNAVWYFICFLLWLLIPKKPKLADNNWLQLHIQSLANMRESLANMKDLHQFSVATLRQAYGEALDTVKEVVHICKHDSYDDEDDDYHK